MRRDNSKWTMFLWGNESHIESDRTNDLLHNFNPEGLVFIPCEDFFNILIGCFALSLSSLLIKILPIRSTSEAIAGDPFWKTESPTRLVSWESSDQISRPYWFVQRRHIRVKTKKAFFAFKVFPTICIFGWPHIKLCQHSEKHKMTTAEASGRVSQQEHIVQVAIYQLLRQTFSSILLNSNFQSNFIFQLKSGFSRPRQNLMVVDRVRVVKIA